MMPIMMVMMLAMPHRRQHSWFGDDTVVMYGDAVAVADVADDTDAADAVAVADDNGDDTEDEDDAGDDDASQAPAFLAGCGHWTNIHFEMGLPTTPIH